MGNTLLQTKKIFELFLIFPNSTTERKLNEIKFWDFLRNEHQSTDSSPI